MSFQLLINSDVLSVIGVLFVDNFCKQLVKIVYLVYLLLSNER